MKKYAVSLVYWKQLDSDNIKISLVGAVVLAHSKNEALGNFIAELSPEYNGFSLSSHLVIDIESGK